MVKHQYLRAYLAGIAVPTILLLVVMAGYTFLRYVVDIPVPIERVIVFPMAVVPNLWGWWNVLYQAAFARRNVPLGLYGTILLLFLAPIGYGVARLLDFSIPGIVFSAFIPFVFPFALILYYFAWKYLVGFLNRELSIA
jgi:hypothetical protein